MKYVTTTQKGNEITAQWDKDHIEIVVWRTGGIWVEWAYTQTYAIYRWEWLLKNA